MFIIAICVRMIHSLGYYGWPAISTLIAYFAIYLTAHSYISKFMPHNHVPIAHRNTTQLKIKEDVLYATEVCCSRNV
jgi:hypothetical protein